MSSKQRQMSQLPSTPKKSIPYSMILMGIHFDNDKQTILRSLRSNYRGVKDIARYFLKENDEELIPGISIEMQSEDLAKNLINNKNIIINNQIYSIETAGRSLIVMNIPADESIKELLRDLSHNYTTIESISRFCNNNTEPISCIRITFKSDANLIQILKDKHIFINGKKAPIRPYWSLVYVKDVDTESTTNTIEQNIVKPKQTNRPRRTVLTEGRVRQLFDEHQKQLETMIKQFETEWNRKLLALGSPSNNTAMNPLLPVVQDLSNLCQQFTQQNNQIQRQMRIVDQRLRNVHMTSNNEYEYPSLNNQNGH